MLFVRVNCSGKICFGPLRPCENLLYAAMEGIHLAGFLSPQKSVFFVPISDFFSLHTCNRLKVMGRVRCGVSVYFPVALWTFMA